MSQYVLIMIWMGIIYFISKKANVYQEEYVCGKKEVRATWGFALFCVIPLIWWAATRPNQWIFDTNAYAASFKNMPQTISGMAEYMKDVKKDRGFSVVSILIKTVIGNRVIIYFGIIAAVHLILLAKVFRKYSSDYVIALFLFVATTDYLSWVHNGIRQFTAVVLIFAATELMLKKKYIPLMITILLASTMHQSALLMIPIVFIVQGEPWNKKTIIAIVFFMLAIASVDRFTNILDEALADTQYSNMVSDWQTAGDDGTNLIRIFIYAIPTILSVIGFPFIKAAKDPVINMACNMGILSTMLYCLSAVTSGIFMGRLPIYCSMCAMGILLPWELKHMFTPQSARVIKVMMVVGFLGFYYYQVHLCWGLI